MVKAWVKHSLATLLYLSGLIWIIGRSTLRGKAIVLMYHRVLPPSEAARSFSHPGIIVSPETFARHLDLIQKFLHPLSVDEFRHHLERRAPFPPGACLITFDDGWVDNHTYALPELTRRSLPALVFIATDYIDSNTSFWQERLGHLLYQASRHHVISPVLSARDLPPLHGQTDRELRTSIRRLLDTLRALEYDEIDDLIGQLETVLEANGYVNALRPVDQFMTWRQVRDLLQHGIAIGSHTCSHKSLTRLTDAELQAELTNSRERIREHTGTEVTTLAYPSGHFDSRSIRAASSNEYGLAFTTERGFAVDTTEPLRIPRLNIHEAVASTTPLFVSHLFQVFRKWRRNPT